MSREILSKQYNNLSNFLQIYSVYADYRTINVYTTEFRINKRENETNSVLSFIGIGLQRDSINIRIPLKCKFMFFSKASSMIKENCTNLECYLAINKALEREFLLQRNQTKLNISTIFSEAILRKSLHTDFFERCDYD